MRKVDICITNHIPRIAQAPRTPSLTGSISVYRGRGFVVLLQLLHWVTIRSLDLGTADGVHKDLHACACHYVGSISRFPRFVLWPDGPRKNNSWGGTPQTPLFGFINKSEVAGNIKDRNFGIITTDHFPASPGSGRGRSIIYWQGAGAG